MQRSLIIVCESYFGARRVKGKRGRGARGKTIVFGLLKRGYKVYTQIIEKCDRNTPKIPYLPTEQTRIQPNLYCQING
jgi:transposase-like protein